MNNFRKHCAFYLITFTPWRSPPPLWKLQNYGACFLYVKCHFSPFGGPCFPFGDHFLHMEGSPYVAKLLCLSPFAKISTALILWMRK